MPEHRYIETNIDKKNDSANNLLVPRRSAPGIASVPQIRPMQNRACDGASPDSGPQATRIERTENGAFSSVLAANWHWNGRDGARPSAEYKSSVDRNYENNRLDRRERIRRLGHSEGSVVPGPASDGYRAPTGKRGKVPAETVPAHKRPETNERMHGTDQREAPTPEISRPASPSLPPAAWTGAGPPTDRRPAGSGYATRFRFRNPRRTARRSSARRAKRYPRPKRQRTAAAYRAAKFCRRSACR